MPAFGPLVRFELVRLARTGRLFRWRVALALALLLGLLAAYLRTFPAADLTTVLFGTPTCGLAELATFAETFLAVFLAAQLAAVVVLTPAFVGGALTDEVERGTFDLLLVSGLSVPQIVLGKLVARLAVVLSVVLVGLPVLALTLLFGGVDAGRVLAGFAVTVVGAVWLGARALAAAATRTSIPDVTVHVYLRLAGATVAGLLGGVCWPPLSILSPVSCLTVLSFHWSHDAAKDTLTWPVVAAFTGVQLAAAGAFLVLAVGRVRMRSEAVRAETGRRTDLPAEPLVPRESPPACDDRESPLEWKERHFGHGAPLGGHVSTTVRAFLWAAFVFLLMMAVVVIVVNLFNRPVAEAEGFWRSIALLPVIFLQVAVPAVALRTGLPLAASVAWERQQQTLPALFTLPVDRADILTAKLRVAVTRQWPFIGGVVAVLFVGGLASRSPLTALAVAGNVASAVWLLLAFAAWLTVRYRTTVPATVWFLVGLLAVWGGPAVVGPLVDLATGGRWAGAIDRFAPPVALAELAGWGPSAGREWAMAAPLLAALASAAGGRALWRSAVRRLEREGKE